MSRNKRAGTAAAFLFWLIVWQAAASVANRTLLIKIPLPLDTVAAFFRNCTQPDFWTAVGTSLWHITAGFLCAFILGSLGGLLSGRFSLFRTLTAPLLHLVRSVPVAAFIVLAWLWIPARLLPPFISFLIVLPVIWNSMESGLLAVDGALVEMASVMGLPPLTILRRVKMPAVAPFLRGGCITGLGFAWKAGVAAEVICNPSGSVGSLLYAAKSSIDYEQVFAVTLTVVLLSLLLENILKLVWKEKRYD